MMDSKYDESKWLYVPNYYCNHREILGTVGLNPLIVFGVNPSTAEPEHLDNTLKSVDRISHNNGFDSFVMFNVYPQRSTDPNGMDINLNKDYHRMNCTELRLFLNSLQGTPHIWAAWGNLITKRPYLISCLKELVEIANDYAANWYVAGPISKTGHPHHPLYLCKDERLREFNIFDYLNKIITHNNAMQL